MKLGVWQLGIALGIVWGAGILFLGVVAAAFDWGTPVVELVGSVYLGYSTSAAGILVGTIWAFADGFIGGALIAWIYNVVSRRA